MSSAAPVEPAPVSYRRIASLAIPALVVLAAEPIYLLIDTAVVGHLGAVPLAGLALGGVIMGLAPLIGAVLAYGTTARASRRFGAGDRAGAVAEGVQGTWLALAAGLAMVVAFQFLAGPIAGLMGDDPAVEAAAAEWLRVAVLGAPFLLVAGAGQGWMRAVQDTKRPMWFVSVSFLLSAALAPILVYPVGLGLVGSAWANAVAQAISGVLFFIALRREGVPLRVDWPLMSRQLVANGDLIIRGIAFQVSSFSAAAVAARVGTAALGAHQIGMQLWFFAALALDAVAIAGQALIGADLGAGRPAAARASAKRLTIVGFGYGAVFLLAVLVSMGDAVANGESSQRLAVLPAWRDTALFTDRERAALALAESITELPDQRSREREEGYARRHLTAEEFSAVSWLAITMNAFNRVSITSHHPVRRQE